MVITFIHIKSLCNGSVQHRDVEGKVLSPAVAPSLHRQLTGRQSESRKSWGRGWRSRGGSPAPWTVNSLRIWVNSCNSSKTDYCEIFKIYWGSNFVDFVSTPLALNYHPQQMTRSLFIVHSSKSLNIPIKYKHSMKIGLIKFKW